MPLLLDETTTGNTLTSIGNIVNNHTLPDVYAPRMELVDCTIEAGTKIPDNTIIRGSKTQIL